MAHCPALRCNDAIFRFDLTTHALTLGYKMSGVKHLVPSAGSVSQKILFWGSHLLGAISLTCNGVRAADFHVNSTQALAATVLAGATIRPANPRDYGEWQTYEQAELYDSIMRRARTRQALNNDPALRLGGKRAQDFTAARIPQHNGGI